ncbi:uncharacterized protein LOC121380937 [Gigantopelta aegis]|uniref:uncharacterized protein LOC121380937 n=1 Tax=Gigantopelta aegis TaxID=1735272 RepID=UPI001B88B380|nr:uncharacterized protein LOC121380937 [Gigantopelta aegis]
MPDTEDAQGGAPDSTQAEDYSEYRLPNAVTSEELDLSTVRVCLVVNGLQTKLLSGKPKNAEVQVNFQERSFDVTAKVTVDKKKVIKYRKVVKKLPGEIDKSKCVVKYKKDQIILDLKKTEEYSWAVQLSSSGLDQSPDED